MWVLRDLHVLLGFGTSGTPNHVCELMFAYSSGSKNRSWRPRATSSTKKFKSSTGTASIPTVPSISSHQIHFSGLKTHNPSRRWRYHTSLAQIPIGQQPIRPLIVDHSVIMLSQFFILTACPRARGMRGYLQSVSVPGARSGRTASRNYPR